MFSLQILRMASLQGETFFSTSKMTHSFDCTISPQKTLKKKENVYIFEIDFRKYVVRNNISWLIFLVINSHILKYNKSNHPKQTCVQNLQNARQCIEC